MGIIDRLLRRNRSSRAPAGTAPEPTRAPSTFGDEHLAAGQVPQSIGHATANEVFKVRYDEGRAMRGGETAGYFKPNNKQSAPAKNAVAASLLANRLGWDDLIPETHWATHNLGNIQGTTKRPSIRCGVQGRGRGVVGEPCL